MEALSHGLLLVAGHSSNQKYGGHANYYTSLEDLGGALRDREGRRHRLTDVKDLTAWRDAIESIIAAVNKVR